MKRNIFLVFFILFVTVVVINSLFFLVRYILLEREAEKYLLSKDETVQVGTVEQKVTEDVTSNQVAIDNSREKKIAIVIDDLGTRTVRYYLLDAMENKLNLAVIPGDVHSLDIVKYYKLKPNFEVLMHMPMEPFETKEDKESPYSKTTGYRYIITSEDNRKSINSKLDEAFDSIIGGGLISGINNHMGSYVTSSRNMVNDIVSWAKKNKLYVLDSLTAPSSVLYEQARKARVKAAYNQVFLDSVDEPSHIIRQLEQVKRIADRDGQVIAIGHIGKKHTMEILFEWMPKTVEEGYVFSFVSELAQ